MPGAQIPLCSFARGAHHSDVSIATRTGDHGTTGLMYNRRVSKTHRRVEALGGVDELNAALGVARAAGTHAFVQEALPAIQRDLVALMGELATAPEDGPRYEGEGFARLRPEMIARLDHWVAELEAQPVRYDGWATPGASPQSAALDLARSVCRRAERRVVALREAGELGDDRIMVFLNRLADLLWLMARAVESAAK